MLMKDQHTMVTMSFNDAYTQGYVLDTSPTRVVFRTTYKQPHSEIVLVSSTTSIMCLHGHFKSDIGLI